MLDTIQRLLVLAAAVLMPAAGFANTAGSPWGAAGIPANAASAAAPLRDLPPPVASPAAWKPTAGLSWQLQYVHGLDTRVDADVYKVDLFDTQPATVAALRKNNKRVVCYVNAGAWEDWRPDAKRFPDAALGSGYDGWPGERWLDIRRIDALAPVMLSRLDLCRDKGFDGVVLDNVNSYLNRTGFALTFADQLRYNVWLANEAHERGLAVGMNNDGEQARELAPYFDWALTEGCLSENSCQAMRPFTALGKPVIVIEYTDSRARLAMFCRQASAQQITVLAKRRELDAYRMDCRSPVVASR
jgi:hypothetical protein